MAAIEAQKPAISSVQVGDARPVAAKQAAQAFPPERILMAPGPSNLHPRVVQALTSPLVGHKDPSFLTAMDETAGLLRQTFQTRNHATMALPATGGSGMEAALINLLQPGDTVVVARSGFFAARMVAIADRIGDTRLGARVVAVDSPWGQAVDNQQLIDAVKEHGARVLAVVHGETSTGVEQPLAGLGQACQSAGAFLVVDAVASLGGTALPVDELQIDVCYSGSQKCLSAPPGLAPITVSARALEAIEHRERAVPSWYLDLSLHARYWGAEHIYHHTAPVLNVYALREALRLLAEEGLDSCFTRHRLHSRALRAGLQAMGLEEFASPQYSLVTVVTVLAPDGISDGAVRRHLLEDYNIEVGGGLGEYADRMWRIGIMGQSATRANVTLLLVALEEALRREGYPARSGLAAAAAVYSAPDA